MVSIASLWLPILVGTVGVFLASSVIWMVLPYHKTDWKKLPNEDAVLDAWRAHPAPAGMYMVPHCTPEKLKDPAVQERYKRGPWGTITLIAGMPSMGRSLGLWFTHLLIVSIFLAYVTGLSLPVGAEGKEVFRRVSAMAWIVFAGSAIPGSIWEGKPWSFAAKGIIDSLIYALIAGAAFAWLWPGATS